MRTQAQNPNAFKNPSNTNDEKKKLFAQHNNQKWEEKKTPCQESVGKGS